jgi:hypothetical protein
MCCGEREGSKTHNKETDIIYEEGSNEKIESLAKFIFLECETTDLMGSEFSSAILETLLIEFWEVYNLHIKEKIDLELASILMTEQQVIS